MPEPQQQPVPQRVIDTPAALRDETLRLHSYLSKLDGAMQEAEAWVEMRQKPLIFGAHWLEITIKTGREKEAFELLGALGDMAGLVLGFKDYEALAKKAFGPDSILLMHMRRQKGVLPDAFRAPPPAPEFAPVAASPLLPAAPPPPPAPEKKWWHPKTWGRRKEEAAPVNTAADIATREWKEAQDVIAHMQDHRQYYVDSFMDWAGETLAPENPQAPKGTELMQDYLQPQRIAQLAEQDYRDRLARLGRDLATQSNAYGRMAALLDDGNVTLFSAHLYPEPDTTESRLMRKWLLEDYGAASFTELALARRVTPQQRQWLLKAALGHERNVVLADPLRKGQHIQIREKILSRARDLTVGPDGDYDRDALRLLKARLDELYEEKFRRNPRSRETSLADIFERTVDGLERKLRELYDDDFATPDEKRRDRYRPVSRDAKLADIFERATRNPYKNNPEPRPRGGVRPPPPPPPRKPGY